MNDSATRPTYQYLPKLFRGVDFTKLMVVTGLSRQSLEEIAGTTKSGAPPRAATAGEAVVLGKFFRRDPIKLLHRQIMDELTAAGYKAPPFRPGTNNIDNVA